MASEFEQAWERLHVQAWESDKHFALAMWNAALEAAAGQIEREPAVNSLPFAEMVRALREEDPDA